VATIFPEKRDRPGLAEKRGDRPRVSQEQKVIFVDHFEIGQSCAGSGFITAFAPRSYVVSFVFNVF
jgi:hypothetical protein